MIFAWDDLNRGHIAKHGVTPGEAEEVVTCAASPYPMEIADDKLIVWGATQVGRYLQVIYVLQAPEAVSYESLAVDEWMDIEAGTVTVIARVIHAMDLTPAMKKRLRKGRR